MTLTKWRPPPPPAPINLSEPQYSARLPKLDLSNRNGVPTGGIPVVTHIEVSNEELTEIRIALAKRAAELSVQFNHKHPWVVAIDELIDKLPEPIEEIA